MSTTITKPATADELFAMPDDGFRYELVEGELIRMAPAGAEHGRVAVSITAPLFTYVKAHNLGEVFAAETGFKLRSEPDTVRAPDVAFVSKARIEEGGITESYWAGAPDLAVEVLSPSDRRPAVERKVRHWLSAGARLVWVVRPRQRTITVYQSLNDAVVLTQTDTLDGGDVLPGFQIAVAEIFGK